MYFGQTHRSAPTARTNTKEMTNPLKNGLVIGRGDRIRTCDHLVPNQVRYRTALHPVTVYIFLFNNLQLLKNRYHNLQCSVNLLFSMCSHKRETYERILR